MESMDIAETPSDTLSNRFNNLTVVHSSVTSLDVENKVSVVEQLVLRYIFISNICRPKYLSSIPLA